MTIGIRCCQAGGDALDGAAIARERRVAEHEAEIEVADERAEAAVGEAAESVGRDEAVAERRLVGSHGVAEEAACQIVEHRPGVSHAAAARPPVARMLTAGGSGETEAAWQRSRSSAAGRWGPSTQR